MNGLIVKVISGIIGISASIYLLPMVSYDGEIKTILLVGAVTGLLLFFIRPLLSLITLPIRLITFNLFSIVIMLSLIWLVNELFPSYMFNIVGLNNLFFSTLIIWGTEKLTSAIL
ncbi:MAG: phage holin family protein [Candidatus Pacebacteria bacterium]|nr:phage holin family protein [Candidatus Paceibacterota bacterium]MDD2757349.1 phage holin family protein [Candidatus Paceibacterota bacterium]MDD3283952.1 phage holin family protein [Candidatus Paceibacterota bacterium]MDD3969891.1 phage holin family protein [Candidatus Paceibacterota bacterium]MDD4737963.1 phage holin family protein [Candidatus Paceibacterota bacterium]